MPTHPESADEELINAEVASVDSLLDDEERVKAVSAELRDGFGKLAHIGAAVSIFGSARTPEDHPEYALARTVARRFGEEGYAIITGGGPGAMEAANRGARDAGVPSIGLDIQLPHEQFLNRYVDIGLTFHYFFTRKVMFVRYASAFVCVPGGFGTFDELFEVLTLRQTGKIRDFPVVLMGVDYWQPMIDWLSGPVLAGGKIEQADIDRILLTDDLDAVVAAVKASEARTPRHIS